MRRKDREITDLKDIVEIIKKCDVCRLALFDCEYPYIIPLNFGFSFDGENIEFYFHGANAGKKLSLLGLNNKVGFEMDCSHRLITGEKACDYTMEYESVCGNGIVSLLNDDQKIDALTHLMKQYSKEKTFEFNEINLKAIAVFKLNVNEITAKALKQKQKQEEKKNE